MKPLGIFRPIIWLARFPHRRGYGVHSPFAFNLITQVIYQRTPYYKYKELAAEERRLAPQKNPQWLYESRKVKRLLFRLVNFAQPDTIIDAGTLSASSLYLKAAKVGATYINNLLTTQLLTTNYFLYLHHYRDPKFVEETFSALADRATQKSLFVVEGIRYTRPMHELWKQMVKDPRAGITFDLYDLGLIFFDHTKLKQDYIVNF